MPTASTIASVLAAGIDAARDAEGLAQAAGRVEAAIEAWYAAGVPVQEIAAEVSRLNRSLLSRQWSMLASASLASRSCLLVMGSEGRGEQLLKTDQDNALLLPDDLSPAGIREADEAAARFSEAMERMGWPPCPGGIMTSNPLWRQPVANFRETITGWCRGNDPEGPMRLAIFLDATPVAGDPEPLRQARRHLQQLAAGSDAFLARFARAADQFSEPGNWWTRLTRRREEQAFDLKKLGLFPIVHGVRALALQHGVAASGTVQRLRALGDIDAVDTSLAAELTRTLHTLMTLRLSQQLQQRRDGEVATNVVQPSQLPPDDAEQLHASLAVVRRWRAWLHRHFRLDAL